MAGERETNIQQNVKQRSKKYQTIHNLILKVETGKLKICTASVKRIARMRKLLYSAITAQILPKVSHSIVFL